MEVSDLAYRHLPCYSGAGFGQTHSQEPSFLPAKLRISSEFSDDGHLQYYAAAVCKKEEKGRRKYVEENRRRMKLIKGLSRDLSALTLMRDDLLKKESRGQMISLLADHGFKETSQVDETLCLGLEAADALLAQLQDLRAEEKKAKRRRKEEKAALKAARMKAMANGSSSSESSDSECGQTVDVSHLRSRDLTPLKMDQPQPIQMETSMVAPQTSNKPCHTIAPSSYATEDRHATPVIERPSISARNGSGNITIGGRNRFLVDASLSERIEVCMGGKCKKSGAAELLEEFERMVGVEGAVVGCKCMGKCRDGPNVRVLNRCNRDTIEIDGGSSNPVINPLCIGVGLEDVDVIVANVFGEKKDLGLTAAS